jgi:NAD-dependent dihydropyrimidine dehydrogenase PreA subunit
MNLLSLIYFAPRRPAVPAATEPPPVPPRENADPPAHRFASWSHALSVGWDKIAKQAPAHHSHVGSGSQAEVVSLSPDRDTPPPLQKLLPVIDTDSCIGCERCVNICDRGCLEMIWSFSTLTHPQTCCGEAHCVEACPERIIRMAWLPIEAPTT